MRNRPRSSRTQRTSCSRETADVRKGGGPGFPTFVETKSMEGLRGGWQEGRWDVSEGDDLSSWVVGRSEEVRTSEPLDDSPLKTDTRLGVSGHGRQATFDTRDPPQGRTGRSWSNGGRVTRGGWTRGGGGSFTSDRGVGLGCGVRAGTTQTCRRTVPVRVPTE